MKNKRKFYRQAYILVLSILISLLAGFIGSLFTTSAIPLWYDTLIKPSFAPPNWLFGPVWTLLYVLMGISVYLILIEEKYTKKIKLGIALFFIQLIFNSIWSILFFGFHEIGIAFIEIIILWGTIIITMYMFYVINKKAAYLLIPYLLWVSFAVALNFAYFMLNL